MKSDKPFVPLVPAAPGKPSIPGIWVVVVVGQQVGKQHEEIELIPHFSLDKPRKSMLILVKH